MTAPGPPPYGSPDALRPRKQPRQARSRATVDRILASGREVLLSDGYDAFSTNRVADAAGISPGSLYQYFPNKHAIVAAIVDRYSDDVSDQVAASLVDRLGEVGPAMVRACADALLTALEENADLLRVVFEELPARQNAARRAALERRVQDLVAAYLAASRAGEPSPRQPTVVAWVLVLAVENLAVRWVLDAPPIPRDVVLDELVRLSLGYLQADRGAGGASA
ncbi:TetR/AcrR family transcriptional regulator [Mumia zhuanghuii]|uniref:TetR/AcrR family transcriptional regulator n=1 Tax=Mumia zhuanghuii TaxID=2585211 RepID=A0A5Q6RJW9_9ACTN|nr:MULTISPECIES: TetR/AcrR family transcriptional regulator [Mumia]KAA1418322.1 TetR/AcrR family transcriptional regulator [Mumia zhuanghuii]